MGYTVVLLQDRITFEPVSKAIHVVRPWLNYAGYAKSCNWLVREYLPSNAKIVVFGGDDMLPDPKVRASVIAEQYYDRFPDGMGVMQPIGDDLKGTDKICGSPWCGRGWLDNAYGGAGPFFGDYYHFYADEEMKEVTEAAGLLWQRSDLAQRHEHWTREGIPRPAFYDHIQAKWDHDRGIFTKRKAAGFPGAAPVRAAP